MSNKTKIILIVALVLVVGIAFFVNKNKSTDPYSDKMTIKKASKIGELETHKLLVQIEQNRGNGRYERGDVVLVASSTKEFSQAEKSGFLIIKMNLTPLQTEVLTRPLENLISNDEGEPFSETIKRRKYAVDLEKIGISLDDFSGRELADVYKWDILFEK